MSTRVGHHLSSSRVGSSPSRTGRPDVAATARPAIWALVLVIPLISGGQLGAFRPNEPLLLAAFLMIAPLLLIRPGAIFDRALEAPIALFLIVGSLLPTAVYIARGNALSTDIAPYVAPWQYYLLYRLITGTVTSGNHVPNVLRCLVGAGSILAVVSLLQWLELPAVVSFLETATPSQHLELIREVGYARTTSLLGNWHGAGVYYAFCLLTLGTSWLLRKQLFDPVTTAGLAILLLAALLTTNSFTAFAVTGLGLLIASVLSGRLWSGRLIVAGAAGGVALGFGVLVLWSELVQQFAFQFGSSAYGYGIVARSISFLPRTVGNRILMWQTEFGPTISETWPLGYGPSMAEFQAASDDSQYIYMLLKGGVPYVLGFLVLMGTLAWISWRRFRSAEDRSWPQVVFLLALTLILVMQPAFFLQAYLTYSGVSEYLWVVIGLGSGISLGAQRAARLAAPELLSPRSPGHHAE